MSEQPGSEPPESPLHYGELAPSFALASSNGRTVSRAQFRGKSGLVLIFFRPCPEADVLLNAVNADGNEYRELNVQALGIAYAELEVLIELQAHLSLQFPLLADPRSQTWKAYAGTDKPGFGVVVLDLYGGADAHYMANTLTDFPTAETILDWARAAMYKCSI